MAFFGQADPVKPLLLLLCSSMALAHQPFWNQGSTSLLQAYKVESPSVSKVVTGQLAPGQVAYLAFQLGAGFVLDVGLFVGAACPAAFQPRLWLIGAGLPKTDTPFSKPDGLGARVFGGSWQDYRGHGLVARKGPEFRQSVNGGTYYVVVEAGEAGGYYMVSLGGSEVGGGTAEGRAALARFNLCG
jgi:hypothetical protein